MKYFLPLFAALALIASTPAFAQGNALDAGMPPFPALTGPVVDNAHLLPPDVFQSLSQRLAAYSQSTGTQLVVVTLPTLNGYPIDMYGYQLGRHWGIGEKGKNNGALLIVDAGEKQLRIEVGYGLEGTLTDAASFEIIHNIITPQFKQGNFAGGISAGVNAILGVLGHEQQAVQQQRVRNGSGTGILMLIIIVIALLPLLFAIFSKGGRGGGPGGYGRGSGMGWLGWMALGMLGGNMLGRGGGFGGGGFSGGGFGGFSGGGGSFGGGGASGGW